MGVPTAIIVIIILIMSMFVIASIIIYKYREKLLTQTIDPMPPKNQQD